MPKHNRLGYLHQMALAGNTPPKSLAAAFSNERNSNQPETSEENRRRAQSVNINRLNAPPYRQRAEATRSINSEQAGGSRHVGEA